MKVLYLRRNGQPEMDVHIAGAVVHFTLAEVEDMAYAVLAADVEDPRVLAGFRQLREHYKIVEDRPVARSEAVSVRPLPASPGPTVPSGEKAGPTSFLTAWAVPAIVETAGRNGWEYNDLTGAGRENRWGIEGGRGLRSGLTMVELSLSIPPVGWTEGLAETHWPWEVLGWKPPALEWSAPALPSKRPPADAAPRRDEPPVREPEGGSPADVAPDGGVLGHDEGPEGFEPPTDEVSRLERPAPPPKAPPETRNEEVLSEFSPDRVEAAVQAVLDTWRASGVAPSVSKARHFIKEKAGIDKKLTNAQVQALLDLAQPRL